MMCRIAPDRPAERITALTIRMRTPTRIRMLMGMVTLIIGGRASGSIGVAGGAADGDAGDRTINSMSTKAFLWASAIGGVLCVAAMAQGPPPPQQEYPPQQQAPLLGPPQLDNLVERIALYPDPLLAQVLTRSEERGVGEEGG